MFKSDEEKFFSWYLDELKDVGFVSDWWYEPTTFTLLKPVIVKKEIILKTKTIFKEKTLLNGLEYTPDFIIRFNKIPDFLIGNDFIEKKDNAAIVWWVDTKGSFNGRNNSSAITFPIKQKLLYYTHNILVQKIIPQKLFAETFTPEKYLFTETGKERKIKWIIRRLKNI